MGPRGAKLVTFDVFAKSLGKQEEPLRPLEALRYAIVGYMFLKRGRAAAHLLGG
jgi:hypothetical protein